MQTSITSSGLLVEVISNMVQIKPYLKTCLEEFGVNLRGVKSVEQFNAAIYEAIADLEVEQLNPELSRDAQIGVKLDAAILKAYLIV